MKQYVSYRAYPSIIKVQGTFVFLQLQIKIFLAQLFRFSIYITWALNTYFLNLI